jgi:Fic-DOC domain mobile mystery protein B
MGFDSPIPGQTPLDDISGLRIRTIRTTAELNAAEAENIRKAVVKYLAARPGRRLARFDVVWLRRVHREMFGDVWTWAGVIRTGELNIGVPARSIEVELQSLVDDLRAWGGYGMPLVEQGLRLHYRAVAIHPFLNGNGRWARLVSNIWLRREGGTMVEWPENSIGGVSTIRERYLEAVRAADAGDLGLLEGLHTEFSVDRGSM